MSNDLGNFVEKTVYKKGIAKSILISSVISLVVGGVGGGLLVYQNYKQYNSKRNLWHGTYLHNCGIAF